MNIAPEIGNFRRQQEGFSLLEVVIATGIMASAIVTLGQLFGLSVASNRAAQALTYTTVLAQQKMEQLRGLEWRLDSLGSPVTDDQSDTTAAIETPAGGTGLSSSPADTLTRNVAGWVDYVDRFGNALGGGANPPARTVYVRRWSVEPLGHGIESAIVIQVLVTPILNRGAADAAASTVRLPGESRLVCVKTRKAQ
jgi:type II secretory pathway pseudopilin PulG